MITGIILASGFSRIMGRDKLLLKIEGKEIIQRDNTKSYRIS